MNEYFIWDLREKSEDELEKLVKILVDDESVSKILKFDDTGYGKRYIFSIASNRCYKGG